MQAAQAPDLLIRVVDDRMPWLAGENGQWGLIVDAVARPFAADIRGAA